MRHAFGDDHARVLRRFLHDHEEFRGEVIFTFDGDAAGQKAALRAFGGDQNFVSQTYVAVEPTGLDPCDLRLQQGDAAVRELVARRVPLYRFVLGNVVAKYDLDRADGRVDAIREAARLVSSIRDQSKVEAFSRELAGMVGVDIEQAREEVRSARAVRPRPRGAGARVLPLAGRAAVSRPGSSCPTCATRGSRSSARRSSSCSSTRRRSAGTTADVGANDFTHPTYRAVWELVEQERAARLRPTPAGRRGRSRPRVRPRRGRRRSRRWPSSRCRPAKEPDAAFVAGTVYRLQELTALRRIAEVKSRLQRTNPVEHATEYNRMFGELVALEQHRRRCASSPWAAS